MGAPRKTLLHLVQDRTFQARRHEHRLAEETIPALDSFDELIGLQKIYRTSPTAATRRAAALAFQKRVRETAEERFARQIEEAAGTPSMIATVEVVFDDGRRGAWRLRVGDIEAERLRRRGTRLP